LPVDLGVDPLNVLRVDGHPLVAQDDEDAGLLGNETVESSLAEFGQCSPSLEYLPELPAELPEDPPKALRESGHLLLGLDDEAELLIRNEVMKETEAATSISSPPPFVHKQEDRAHEMEAEAQGDEGMELAAETDLEAAASHPPATNIEVATCEVKALTEKEADMEAAATSVNLVSSPAIDEKEALLYLMWLVGFMAAAQALQRQSTGKSENC